jgi:hypothetical protein
MTDDLRDKIANRLGEAWPDLTEDPVHLDQLAAQAMTVVGPEVAALRAENAYRLRRDEYIVAERDVLTAQVSALQQALADRGDDVLAFQAEAELERLRSTERVLLERIDGGGRRASLLASQVTQASQRAEQFKTERDDARAEAARHLEHLRIAHPDHFTPNVLGERLCGCGGQWPCPATAEVRTELEQFQAAFDAALRVYAAHHKSAHPTRLIDPACAGCQVGRALSSDIPGKPDSREEIEARIAALDTPTEET